MIAKGMRVIARSTLKKYVASRHRSHDHNALKVAIDAWYQEASVATWPNMATIKLQYSSASIINAERVVFNIKGNSYRLVVAIRFDLQIIFIKWLGTHAEYDKIDVEKVQYGD